MRNVVLLVFQLRVCPRRASLSEMQFPTRAAALGSLQRAWDEEGFPTALPEDVRAPVFRAADDILAQFSSERGLAIDRLLHGLLELSHDDFHAWALCVLSRQQLIYRRFPDLSVESFRIIKIEFGDLVDSSPLGRLLAWKHCMDSAFVAPEHRDQHVDKPDVPVFEPLLDPVQYQRICLASIVRPILHCPNFDAVPVHEVDDLDPTSLQWATS